MKLLSIKNLTKTYNSGAGEYLTALDNFTLNVNRGDFVTIVGSNAAGKSTLFKLITGSIAPTSGDIVIDNQSLKHLNEFQRARIISCVRQNPNESVINTMTVAENLALVKLKNSTIGLKQGVKSEWRQEFKLLLSTLEMGLEKRLDDRMSNLSGGQKQTLALMMATFTKPKLLLLDEHTASLDLKVSQLVLDKTNEIVHLSHVTSLMITHNIRQAIEYGNRLILLSGGKICLDVSGQAKKSLTFSDLEGYFE